ncbi:MAG: thioesterase [Firmicutes bacterium]|nr:thioesterase [Alicyclobacillaceae bacterium]MCL6498089.1 thioesterase [Bacillota bacterium]
MDPHVLKGLQPGMTATVSTVVSEAMTAHLGGQPIHPVLATAVMIEWMEWASRKLILPYLEPEEDAVGYRIEVVHLEPTRVGERFTATAEFLSLDGNRVETAVWAENARGRIGHGRITQVLLAKSEIARRFGA